MMFHKASSFGNDFIVVAEAELAAGPGPGGLVREICDRQRGVGADGVVLYRPSRQGARFRIYNRDGGAAEISGNGMAALAAVLLRRRARAAVLALRSVAGPRRVALLERRGAEFVLDVEIGRPDFERRDFFPFLRREGEGHRAAGVRFLPVSVGNPHAVVVQRRLPGRARLLALGASLEGHPLFPRRTNVEIVQVTGDGRCRVFFYERGVGPTQASSTGSAAVFAVLRRLGLAGDTLAIESAAAAAGEKDGPIRLHWREGIHVQTRTKLICRGEYFQESAYGARRTADGRKGQKAKGKRKK